jgi:hypothetical protein
MGNKPNLSSKLKVAGSNPAGVANKINILVEFYRCFVLPKNGRGRTQGGTINTAPLYRRRSQAMRE